MLPKVKLAKYMILVKIEGQKKAYLLFVTHRLIETPSLAETVLTSKYPANACVHVNQVRNFEPKKLIQSIETINLFHVNNSSLLA